ncbi:MAG: hypothetical protein HXY50_06475 [Ignavibacteriaceae bacterium]|nr:hypothetical protein [Ignavibacteriaceae bacterium]
MKKIFLLIMIMLVVCAFQNAHAQVGYLTTLDSTVTFAGGGNDWVYFFLVDSSGTGDTVTIKKYNPWTATYNPIIVRDDSSDTRSSTIIMPISNKGKSFSVWQAKPGTVQLSRTNRAAPTDKLYYYFYTK